MNNCKTFAGIGAEQTHAFAYQLLLSAHTVASSVHLQKTCLPVNQAAVELAHVARKRGRRSIRENKAGPNVETLRSGELKPVGTKPAKSLK